MAASTPAALPHSHASRKASGAPSPASSPTPSRTPIAVWAAPVLSSVLLWACFFPLNWGWLAPVALVPWLGLVRFPGSRRRLYLAAWIGGLAFYAITLQWLRVADYRMYATWIALTFYCSFYFPVALALVRFCERRLHWPMVLALPLVWTTLEFARAHLLGGFAWYFLAHSQHDYLPMIQAADLGGAYVISFVLAAMNAVLFESLWLLPRVRHAFAAPDVEGQTALRVTRQAAVVAVLVAGFLGYGFWRLSQADFEPGPRVALLQGNLDQRIRNAASDPEDEGSAFARVARHFTDLCDEAARARPDLIVWSETSFPFAWDRTPEDWPADRLPAEFRDANAHRTKLARQSAERWGTPVLLGVNPIDLGTDGRMRRANSAVLVGADGREKGRYDKIHCVPFGEYVPFRESLPWMNAFAPYDFDYSITPGRQLTRFELGPWTFGVVICYEDTDTTLARQYVEPNGSAPPVDFLLNTSNDGWFDGTSEHEEHLAICRFRAIESRRAVGRAVNMGVSAVIDGNGRVVALPGLTWHASKKTTAVVTAAIPLDRRTSLYARWGDWFPWSCTLVLGGGWLWGRRRAARLREPRES